VAELELLPADLYDRQSRHPTEGDVMAPTSALDAMGKIAAARPGISRSKLVPAWKPDPTLQKALEDARTSDNLLKPLQLVVVDLTDDPANTAGFGPSAPAYAGWDDTTQKSIGSLTKLLILYGAYHLRSDLRSLSDGLALGTRADAYAVLRAAYSSLEKGAATRPNLDKIFDPLGSLDVANFARSPQADSTLEATYYGNSPPRMRSDADISVALSGLTFRERLRLMAGWSDNTSSSIALLALGYEYLWRLSKDSGLHQPWVPVTSRDKGNSRPSGLFIGMDYSGGVWSPGRSADWPNRPPDTPPPNHGGNARSVACLLTMLANDALLPDHVDNAGMREMLRRTRVSGSPSRGDQEEQCPIGDGMRQAIPPWIVTQQAWDEDTELVPAIDPTEDLAVSKIGIVLGITPPVGANGLLIRTTRPRPAGAPITITAVLVAIDATGGDWSKVQHFGKALAEVLDKRHGVTT
jgi:hypothetical protein